MRIPVRRRRAFHIPLAVVLALTALPVATPLPVAAAGQLLPDLQMAAPYNLQIQARRNGTRLLRFGTIVWNVGQGPLEVRARQRVGLVMNRVVQRIKTTNGAVSVLVPGMTAFYSGDGHNHWHVQRFIDVSLSAQPGSSVTSEPLHQRKIGFCLVDLMRAPASLRPTNSVAQRVHWLSGCGKRDSQRLRFGISVGWGDDYRPFFTHQHINVTGLAKGVYRLCATVNPAGEWREGGALSANNSYWFDLDMDVAAGTVTPIAHGLGPCTDESATP